LELLERRQRPDGLALRLFSEDLDGPLQAELRGRCDGDGEPQIEIVVPFVVLRYAGMGVDDRGRVVDLIVVDARGDQARSIAERARIELRREVMDQPLALEALDELAYLIL